MRDNAVKVRYDTEIGEKIFVCNAYILQRRASEKSVVKGKCKKNTKGSSRMDVSERKGIKLWEDQQKITFGQIANAFGADYLGHLLSMRIVKRDSLSLVAF